MPRVLWPVPQVRRWQRPMCPRIRLALQITLYRLSIERPASVMLTMLMQPLPKNEIGNTSACLNWEKRTLEKRNDENIATRNAGESRDRFIGYSAIC